MHQRKCTSLNGYGANQTFEWPLQRGAGTSETDGVALGPGPCPTIFDTQRDVPNTSGVSHASDKDYRVFGLDALRALAILMVLAAHTWPSKAGVQYARALAVLGVELFFVMSGFLIGSILLRLAEEGCLGRLAGLFGFWRRRWFRTLPNYYLFLLLHLAWRSWVLGFPDVIGTYWKYFLFLQNFHHAPSLFFPETWSLAVEEWFYLLFALFFWALLRWTRKPWHACVVAVAIFAIIPTLLRAWEAFDPTMPQSVVD